MFLWHMAKSPVSVSVNILFEGQFLLLVTHCFINQTPSIMSKLYVLPFVLLLCSCGTRIDYVGTPYAPSEKVDVFVDPAAVGKPYTVVGKGFVRYRPFSGNNTEKIQSKSITKAKQKGADAILILEQYTPAIATGVNTVLRTDSVGTGLVTIGNSSIEHSATRSFTVLFLKYK
jgi:hypothetical protein